MVFDPSVYTEFRYIAADFTAEDFSYSFSFELVSPTETHQFTERIAFTTVRPEHEVDWPRVRSIAIMLGAVVGLSYYKVAAPPSYVIALEGMTQAGVDYLQVALREGLAEYAYRNEFPGLLSPEIVLEAPLAEQWPVDQHLTPSGDQLVPIGGGKDSVVTVELLAAARMHPVQFAVNPNKIMYRVGRIKGHPVLAASRSLDPHLLELNAVGALNGHVPVTAMN